eukprot:comp21802_c0_seq1/m.49013 comp21802_c0_seq1/g.49013  ORF comp21802_c0_seq1/g.49013 comp21802_c0_seq1/m.49013 type:complete len:340 (+) comp21802_c0_seq1:1153-2172(+)
MRHRARAELGTGLDIVDHHLGAHNTCVGNRNKHLRGRNGSQQTIREQLAHLRVVRAPHCTIVENASNHLGPVEGMIHHRNRRSRGRIPDAHRAFGARGHHKSMALQICHRARIKMARKHILERALGHKIPHHTNPVRTRGNHALDRRHPGIELWILLCWARRNRIDISKMRTFLVGNFLHPPIAANPFQVEQKRLGRAHRQRLRAHQQRSVRRESKTRNLEIRDIEHMRAARVEPNVLFLGPCLFLGVDRIVECFWKLDPVQCDVLHIRHDMLRDIGEIAAVLGNRERKRKRSARLGRLHRRPQLIELPVKERRMPGLWWRNLPPQKDLSGTLRRVHGR